MPCYHPFLGWKTAEGKRLQLHTPPKNPTNFYRIPCGTCLGCRKSQALSWSLRCYLELDQHNRACFTTLTYSDAYVPLTLDKTHLSKFLRRLRKALAPKRTVRFFACGEYGEQTNRPHYHAVLYGVDERDADLLHSTWRSGLTKVGTATARSIAYTAGYTAKKVGHKLDRQERINYETGEVYTWQPPFLHMSRRPGIGGYARQWAHSWRDHAIYQGSPVPVPRFLHQAWKAQASPDDLALLETERQARALLIDDSRIEAAEAIAYAKQSMQRATRSL